MNEILIEDLLVEDKKGKKASDKSFIKKVFQEPFFHFILLGAIIYITGKYYNEKHDVERYTVNVGEKDVYHLISLWEKQYGALPSKKELETIIDSHVREEILYREGLELNLDQDDELIRRRIAQKVEFLQQDLEIAEEPGEDELHDFYEKNKELYQASPTLSFTHIYFSPDKNSEKDIKEKASHLLETLTKNGITRSPDSGDKFPFAYDYSNVTKEDLKQTFGTSVFSDTLYSLSIDKWSGPIKSGYGYHLVYLNNKISSSYYPYAQVKERVKIAFSQRQREIGNNQNFEELKKKYIVNLSGLPDEIQ